MLRHATQRLCRDTAAPDQRIAGCRQLTCEVVAGFGRHSSSRHHDGVQLAAAGPSVGEQANVPAGGQLDLYHQLPPKRGE